MQSELQGAPEAVADFIAALRDKGVSVWLEERTLRYRCSSGALARADRDRLRALKPSIVDFLSKSQPLPEPAPLGRREPSDRVPLTFNQQWWWGSNRRLTGVDDVPATDLRTCSISCRYRGRLHVDALRKAFAELVRRHEALRIKIVSRNGTLTQEIDSEHDFVLDVVELPRMAPDIEAQARQLADEVVFKKMDALFAARLVKLDDDNHVLVAAVSHLLCDRASLGILARDLETLYESFVRGTSPDLPEIPVQYSDYAVWQHKTAAWWREVHGPYWEQRHADAPEVRFPSKPHTSQAAARFSIAETHVRLGDLVSSRLKELTRNRRTTVVMGALTAFVAAVLRSLEKDDVVVGMMADGRDQIELQNTIGLFASPLYLRVRLKEEDSFLDLLQRITHEYREGLRHNDRGRAWLPPPGPDFARNISLNWFPDNVLSNPTKLPKGSRQTARVEEYPLTTLAAKSWDDWSTEIRWEPSMTLADTPIGIAGSLIYPGHVHETGTIYKLARNIELFANELVQHPHRRISSVSCTS
jgi:hypothetical protein